MPEISVIVPVYRVEKYLKEALDSLLLQTFQDFEAILVDDGSPDNCPQILDEYAKKDKRFSVIHQSNQGVSVARNNGLQKSTGKYIFFMDPDDIIHPQLLETAYYFAKQYDADMVSFEFQKLKTSTPEISLINKSKIKHIISNHPLYLGTQKRGKRIGFSACTKLYKRESIKNLNFIPNCHFEDYPFTFAVLARHPKTVVLNTELYFYRINLNSFSNQNISVKQVEDHWKALKYIEKNYQKPKLQKERRFIIKHLIPNILKKELKFCQKANPDIAPLMYQKFAEELKDLYSRDLIKIFYHRLDRYFIYRQLIKKGKL